MGVSAAKEERDLEKRQLRFVVERKDLRLEFLGSRDLGRGDPYMSDSIKLKIVETSKIIRLTSTVSAIWDPKLGTDCFFGCPLQEHTYTISFHLFHIHQPISHG